MPDVFINLFEFIEFNSKLDVVRVGETDGSTEVAGIIPSNIRFSVVFSHVHIVLSIKKQN